jgi:hypothetical protein
VQGVVRQAQEVSAILPAEEREVLVAAAHLHDLGYAPALVETGFHALRAPATFLPSAMSGWRAWLPFTPALGVRLSCVG